MSRRDLIDPESREPLDQLLAVLPGGFNAIPDIVARRDTAAQLLAAIEVPPTSSPASNTTARRPAARSRCSWYIPAKPAPTITTSTAPIFSSDTAAELVSGVASDILVPPVTGLAGLSPHSGGCKAIDVSLFST